MSKLNEDVALCMALLMLIALFCLVLVSNAMAGVTCQTTEDGYTYCWNSTTKESTTCQTVGEYTYCN